MALKLPIYMDNHATTRGRSARARGDAAVLHRALRQRRQPQPLVRLDGREGGRAGARASRRADRRDGQGDRLDLGRDRVEQPGDQGRGRVLQGPRQPHHHRADRAQGGARHLQAPREARASRSPTCRVEKDGLVDPGDAARGDDRQDDPGARSCSPTTRSASSSRSTRSARSSRSTARSSTPTRCRASARSRSTSRSRTSTWCRCRRTRCTGPRASARCTCAASRACASTAHHRRRRSRARHALGHAQRAGHRRLRQGGRALPAGDGRTRRKRTLALRERLRKGS